MDVAREQLGNEPFFTHKYKSGDKTCRSRIDQIYAPHTDALYWIHNSAQKFMEKGIIGYDHIAIQASCREATGERGKDIQPIDETVLNRGEVIETISSIINNLYPEVMEEVDAIGAWLFMKRAILEKLL